MMRDRGQKRGILCEAKVFMFISCVVFSEAKNIEYKFTNQNILFNKTAKTQWLIKESMMIATLNCKFGSTLIKNHELKRGSCVACYRG